MKPQWLSEIDNKQLKKSCVADLTPISLNKDKQSGEFAASTGSTYKTTLNNCDCAAFDIYPGPCKHQIRLAMECGLLSNDGIITDLKVAQLKMYPQLIYTFVKEAPYDKAKELVDFFATTIYKTTITKPYETSDFKNYKAIQCLVETKANNVKYTKKGSDVAKHAIEAFYKRIGEEYYRHGTIGKQSTNSNIALE